MEQGPLYIQYMPLAMVAEAALNPKRHDLNVLATSIDEFGYTMPMLIDERTGRLVAGHGRLKTLLSMKEEGSAPPDGILVREEDGEWLVPIIRGKRFPSDAKALAYLLADNRTGERGDYDLPELLEALNRLLESGPDMLLGTGWEPEDRDYLEEMLAEGQPEAEVDDLLDDEQDAIDPGVVPSEWELDPEWGIPILDIRKQATDISGPWVKWGSIARTTVLDGGTYHFYTDDYKFVNVWNDPSVVAASKCNNAVEINFSTGADFPKVQVLYNVYRKRTLARMWQDAGLNTFVDMCVETPFAELNMIGVPDGWKAYCTRAYTDYQQNEIPHEYEVACKKAGTKEILFVVYGGGVKTRALCDKNGWTWFPEHNDSVRGRY